MTLDQAIAQADRLQADGRLAQAEALLNQIITRLPGCAPALHRLGALAGQTGRPQMACEFIRRAIEIDPTVAYYHSHLGNALHNLGQFEQAIVAHSKAIELQPNNAEAHVNFGISLAGLGRSDEAIAAFHRAIALSPNFADAHFNLGVALGSKGQLQAAIAAYSRAADLQPNLAKAHCALGAALLLSGDFAGGWPKYEWRWKAPDLSLPRHFDQPQWTGEALAGKTILVHADQGYGDTIHFIRYVRLLADRGARVIVECPVPLVRLVGQMPQIDRVCATGEPLPPFDLHCPLMSLAAIFDTRLETIPGLVPYLHAKCAVSLNGPGPHIGLAWAGNPRYNNDRNRSIPLKHLAPFAGISSNFHSLQIGPPAQLEEVADLHLIDHTPQITDFADTANLIQSLDLVIAVDTAVAHLAGAMGKPVWLMLPFVPDWRWLLDRDDSPWYPTMRLFRQSAVGDWAGVVQRVVQALKKRWP